MSNPFLNGIQSFFGGGDGQNRANGRPPEASRRRAAGRPASGIDDVESFIQSVLGGAHDSFEAATQAAIRASMRDQQNQPTGPPPASGTALKNLPLITVASEDLVENRECSICLEEHEIGSVAVRMPCAHIFHKNCVVDWLKSHCTCPVCRYELPTDDANFERQREERMRNRKPRYARHELERLSIRELKQLVPAQRRYHAVDRSDLIDYLIRSGAIDLISSPEPVEYSLSALRQMGVLQLKRCMNEEAGVFFDPKDVVEKEDMIRIFQASGRLCLLPEDDEPATTNTDEQNVSPYATSNTPIEHSSLSTPFVETVDDGSSPTRDLRNDTTVIMEECDPDLESTNVNNDGKSEDSPDHQMNSSDTIMDVDENAANSDEGITQHGDDMIGTGESQVPPESQEDATELNKLQDEQETNTLDATVDPVKVDAAFQDYSSAEETQLWPQEEEVAQVLNLSPQEGEEYSLAARADPTGVESSAPDFATRSNPPREVSDPMDVSSDDEQKHTDPTNTNRKRSLGSAQNEGSEFGYEKLSISDLRRLARVRSVNLTGCFERNDIIEKLSSTEVEYANKLEVLLRDYSLSELLMLASIAGMDVSSVRDDRDDVLSAMENEAARRPHAANFIKALLPFVRLTPAQLRAVARQRGISCNDCLEKRDFLLRLAQQ
mmetsp:Transcript_4131/g.8532  ORF Transcript_4131/g.8532 Transcript_4131/m.8532 type:complete len:664 (-) Transcript_4131:276-2267(-)|eukprot:CAMPEP_0168732738 /NCGR_PEP_ID=MMETSP0724-20121128/7922_1 /TAXON_ID=265536 /ORGANISM="Amphiprora sp., Strain CCMP467" /LENGTH=663 /DNA_ID=CAMNT_0008779759 /DNA_START=27 /DNA_END=2018 /DNA_ORIENTATION=-